MHIPKEKFFTKERINTVLIAFAVFLFILSPLKYYFEAHVGFHRAAVQVVIPPGASARTVEKILIDKHVLYDGWMFLVYLKLNGLETSLRPGTFMIPKWGSFSEIMGIMMSNVAQDKQLRVIEGWNLHDIAHEVERMGFGTQDEFLKLTGKPATDYRDNPKLAPSIDWAKEFPILADKPTYVSLEGYLFPDTYRFALDATPEDVIRKLLQEFSKKFDKDMLATAQQQKKSVFEIVTMASIVEKEVNGDVDRAKVADLLWRRNEINWGLQCDSTVKYATGTFGSTPFTTAADRASQSEYNTYEHYGLPLGPISNPGMSSLNATLHPKKNDAWYFLTTPDGEVKYAKSLEEHTANKRYMR